MPGARHPIQWEPLVSDPGMHHGTCVTHVPWCMSGSLTRGGGENVPGIPGACSTRNFTYLVRGPLIHKPPKYRDRRFALIYEFIHLKNREAAQRNFLDDHYQYAAYLCQPEAAFIYDDSHVRFILQMPHNRSMAYTVEFLDYQTINTKNGVWTQ